MPNRAPVEVPRMTLARTWPPFCQYLYESYSTQNSNVSSASSAAKRFWFSMLVARSRYGSTIARFTVP